MNLIQNVNPFFTSIRSRIKEFHPAFQAVNEQLEKLKAQGPGIYSGEYHQKQLNDLTTKRTELLKGTRTSVEKDLNEANDMILKHYHASEPILSEDVTRKAQTLILENQSAANTPYWIGRQLELMQVLDDHVKHQSPIASAYITALRSLAPLDNNDLRMQLDHYAEKVQAYSETEGQKEARDCMEQLKRVNAEFRSTVVKPMLQDELNDKSRGSMPSIMHQPGMTLINPDSVKRNPITVIRELSEITAMEKEYGLTA